MKWTTFKKLTIFTLILISITNLQALALDTQDNNNKKTIYLTFDDGPAGKVTSDTLDILKKECVPATFFLIGEQIKGQEDLVKRMCSEGHSIGLHSMTHRKGYLYCSNENFLKDMLETQEVINSVVNFKPTILKISFWM